MLVFKSRARKLEELRNLLTVRFYTDNFSIIYTYIGSLPNLINVRFYGSMHFIY